MPGSVPRSWGYWTEGKLDILRNYLDAFTTALKRAKARIYMDAFAGEGEGIRRDTGERFDGSARLALQTDSPPFSRCYFFELPRRAEGLRRDLSQRFPGRDIRVLAGDCNDTIVQALEELWRDDLHHAPTFAFLDPFGMDLRWATIELLAQHKRRSRGRFKVELWILFPSSALLRVLALDPNRLLPGHEWRATALFGSEGWRRIHRQRVLNEIDGAAARERYVNLYRWRLKQDLGYRWTYAVEVKNLRGQPIYHMVFATDNDAGRNIMRHLYGKALIKWPQMRAEALRRRGGFEQLQLLDPTKLPVPRQLFPEDDPVDPETL